MDKESFGSFPCARKLTEVLDENPSYKKKVCKLIDQYLAGLSQLRSMKDNTNYKRRMIELWERDHLERANFGHPKVDGFTRAVIVAYFRQIITP